MHRELSRTSFGILLYLVGILNCVLTNIFTTITITKFKLPIWEVLCCRQIVIVTCLMPFIIKTKFNFFDKTAFKSNLVRNVLFSFAVFLLYNGISKIPFNEASVIMFITPIIGSILSVKLLKETATKSVKISLLLSILGVLIVKQPCFDNHGLLIGYISLFASVVIRGYIVVLNKQLAEKFNTTTMLFYTNIIMLAICSCFFYQFEAINTEIVKYILLIATLFFFEYFFIYRAYKYCKAITLQSLEFSSLLFTMAFSSLIVGENIKTNQIIGGFVVASGYFLILFEKHRSLKGKKQQTKNN